MGISVDVQCSECSYRRCVLIGRGRRSAATYEPVICKPCGEVTGADITQDRLACRRCGAEHVVHLVLGPDLQGGRGAVTGPAPQDVVYACPKCGKQALRLAKDGSPIFWD
jgi:uncharacterized Zn finger protein